LSDAVKAFARRTALSRWVGKALTVSLNFHETRSLSEKIKQEK